MTVVHTGVEDLAGLVRQGDVVVAAAGRAGLVTPDMVKPGAAVVGAGTSWDGKKLLSDVDEAVAEVAGWITPRIGGVGPMTRAMLLTNAVRAAERGPEPVRSEDTLATITKEAALDADPAACWAAVRDFGASARAPCPGVRDRRAADRLPASDR